METLDADALADHQLRRLNTLLETILPANHFYAEKLSGARLPLRSIDELARLPFTYKEELVTGPDHGDVAANLTWPAERYVRYHQTSGTRGRPMVVLDTADDWKWWIDAWQYVLDAAGFQPDDRLPALEVHLKYTLVHSTTFLTDNIPSNATSAPSCFWSGSLSTLTTR